MDDAFVLDVREAKPPILATIAPALYLFAAALAVRAVMMDRSIDVGISGLLVALGLVPSFVIPAIFSTRRARLSASTEGLLVDGSLFKITDARITRADRGSGRLVVEMRDGTTRTFLVPQLKDGQRLVSLLPPVSAPAGALVA
jgi:hypothetical protein